MKTRAWREEMLSLWWIGLKVVTYPFHGYNVGFESHIHHFIAPIVIMVARLTCNQFVTVQICVGAFKVIRQVSI